MYEEDKNISYKNRDMYADLDSYKKKKEYEEYDYKKVKEVLI